MKGCAIKVRTGITISNAITEKRTISKKEFSLGGGVGAGFSSAGHERSATRSYFFDENKFIAIISCIIREGKSKNKSPEKDTIRVVF